MTKTFVLNGLHYMYVIGVVGIRESKIQFNYLMFNENLFNNSAND